MINLSGYPHKIFYQMLPRCSIYLAFVKTLPAKFVHHDIIYVHDRPLSCHDTPFAERITLKCTASCDMRFGNTSRNV